MIEVFETDSAYGVGVVKSWASSLDDKTREQAEAISRVSIMDGHLALMPDAHFGYGPPVGSALKTRGAVMPYAVGVDIGCGMIAQQTTLERDQFGTREERRVLGNIRELIPSGVGKSHQAAVPQAEAFVAEHGLPEGIGPRSQLTRKKKGEGQVLLAADHTSLADRLRIQFGTLGSGNHFVEVCSDEAGVVWLLLHSGSRGIGNVLATAHVDVAKAFCADNGIKIESNEFAYVVQGTSQFRNYISDMLWCQQYALMQRDAMMDSLAAAVGDVFPSMGLVNERINCHHNYAEELEPGLWLTRKGAIDASVGKLGSIPGSMGAATYIVQGKGDPESYNSSPHGAGRVMGRGEAKRTLDLDEFKAQMADRTWMDRDAEALLDEAPSAYKPIAQVMEDSKDLINPLSRLTQFINYKGL